MSQPETTTKPLPAYWETIPTTEHPVRTSSLPADTTTTAPQTPIIGVPAIAASVPAVASPEGPNDSLVASAIQVARDGQIHVGSSSPLLENHPASNSSAPRHNLASIWPESEAVSSAEADRDEGCGLKHFFWACVRGISYLCCMT